MMSAAAGGGVGDEVRCGGWRKRQEVGWQTEAVAPFLWEVLIKLLIIGYNIIKISL